MHPLLGDYLSFVPPETVKNATELLRDSYTSSIVLLVSPRWQQIRAPLCVCARFCVGPSYFTDSSLFNIPLYGNTNKMRGFVSYTAVPFLKYRVLPPLRTAPCGSITPLNTPPYIAYRPTLHRWSIPQHFTFSAPILEIAR